MTTIIISDLHLGSSICRVDKIISFLNGIDIRYIDRLILNGDVFDSLNFKRLNNKHLTALEIIHKIAKSIEVIWIVGNHEGCAKTVFDIFGINSLEEYVFESGLQKIVVLHGHKFDYFVINYPKLIKIVDYIYFLLQKTNLKLAQKANVYSKALLKCSERLEDSARVYAKSIGCNVAILGHSHIAVAKDGYYNSGSWIESTCHYIIMYDGDIYLCEY